MSNLIIFYDFPSQKGEPYSPNTWKTRFCLNYKGVPYHTIWVEHPEVEELCKMIGAAPTSKKADGTPFYTLPVIYDPTTNTTLSESIRIAEYLDGRYPDKPLIPKGTRALQHMFPDAYVAQTAALFQFAMPLTHKFINPASQDYFRATRERVFGKTMETLTPTGEARDVEWAKLRKGFDTVDGWLQKSKVDGPWFLGEQISFVDFVVGARLKWIRQIFGEDSAEWADIKTWNDGRWAAFAEGLKRYEVCATC